MSDDLYDLAVIGGGITGAAIARDAAGRGARVLLLEAGDLASGASSASTKLIRGALPFVEHCELAPAREALTERERLWRIAPHVVRPLQIVLPHARGLLPRWLLRLGLFLHDHTGARKHLPGTKRVKLPLHPAGAPLKPRYRRAYIYSECWADDSRLVMLNARDAADRGAEVLTHCPVRALAREGNAWRVDTPEAAFHARALVNAAGVAVLDVLALAGEHSRGTMRLERGAHIVVPTLFDHAFAYALQAADGRMIFAVPYEQDFTLIGATGRDHTESLASKDASPQEIGELCEAASRYFHRQVTPEDVAWSYAGVRALPADRGGRFGAGSGAYRLELSDADKGAPILSVFGGTIATHRRVAEAAIHLLQPRLPSLAKADWTPAAPLPGGDFPMEGGADLTKRVRERLPFLAPACVARLVKAYGTLVFDIFGDATSLEDCGRYFGHGLTEREVRYLIQREWARSADDVLWRRTKLGLRFAPDEAEALAGWMEG